MYNTLEEEIASVDRMNLKAESEPIFQASSATHQLCSLWQLICETEMNAHHASLL